MKKLNELEAKEELKKYLPTIIETFKRAERELSGKAHQAYTKRTLAGITRDLAVYHFEDLVAEIEEIEVIKKDNTVQFRIGESIVARFKKLDKKFNAKYNHTHNSRSFTNQQFESKQIDLFGENARLTSIHIGYVLDEFGIGIKDIIITCPTRSGRAFEWIMSVTESTELASTINTSTINTPELFKEGNERFRIKSNVRKSKPEDDRTGSGS